jgi:hypothetical protein
MTDAYQPITKQRFAMLIDGDNAQPKLTGEMLAETGKYGLITIRRIYGDWTTSNMGGWKDLLQMNAIQPIQQFRYTTGKNATDSAMIIDAMDLLYSGLVNSFCLVSSDSDYTRLATRIREKGFFVMGIGKKSTPRAFVNACDVFLYTENLGPQKRAPHLTPGQKKDSTEPTDSSTPDPLPLLRSAFDMAMQDDGWASLGVVGSHLRQLDPGFDPRTYGYKQLSRLINAYSEEFKIREIKNEDGPSSTIYVKLKE